MTEKRTNMDAETRAELGEIKSDLHATLIKTITEEFRGLKDHLSELFNKDIDYINKKLEHFQNNHVEHYDDDKERRQEIAKLREDVDRKIAKIKEDVDEKMNAMRDKVSVDIYQIKEDLLKETISQDTKEKEEEKGYRRKEINYGAIGAITAIACVITAVITLLVA